jgi:hypothetical protein
MRLDILVTLISSVYAQVLATYHDYEADRLLLGSSYDNSPGWCGIRYSVLNVARITAINGMNEGLCNQCLAVQNVNGGPIVYVLAVDQKQGPGLDIAKSSYQAINPNGDPLDPSTVRYQLVDSSHCTGICQGSREECTLGQRNLLPANLLESRPLVESSLTSSSGSGGGHSRPNPTTSSTTVVVTTRPVSVDSTTSTIEPIEPTTQVVVGSAPEPIYGVFESSTVPTNPLFILIAILLI